MDKLKQSLSRSKNDEPEDTTGATGKVTGPGSHFRSAKESTGLGSSTTGPESDTTTGPSTTTGAVNTSAAQYTSGPEAGGDQHVGTTDASAVENPTTAASGGQTSQPIGETSTYSSTPLAKGDPTSSVVDTESNDPVTYQKPERIYAGVPEGAATTAASKAFGHAPETMPGSYPSKESQAGVGGGPSALATTAATTALGQNTASSTLTDTTNPGERFADYGEASKSRGLDSPSTTEQGQSQPTLVGKVLGAVGLGSLAGAGAAKAATSSDDTAVADTPDQSIATSAPPSHSRKESIPTTAYPAGPGSPSPTAPPVGGTQPREQTQAAGEGRAHDAAVGAAIVGGTGALGAGSYAAHDRGENKSAVADTTAPSAAPIYEPATTESAKPGPALDAPTNRSEPSAAAVTTEPKSTTTQPGLSTEPEKKEDHTGRNVAAASAAGVGVGAAGAYAAHEHSQKQAEEEAARRAAEQNELAKQQAAQQKEFERQQKEAEKAAAKQEKEHQKEVEKKEKAQEKAVAKEEKKHQKELEKEEKKHEKEVLAAEKEREEREARERKELEDEENRRREKELAAATGVGAAGAGAATYAATRDDDTKPNTLTKRPKDTTGTTEDTTEDGGAVEKKPSILKRIFKRSRKNKDNGEDEEYDEEGGEEDDSHKGAATVAGVGAAGAAGAGAAHYAGRDDDKLATDPSDKSYEAQSGGLQKPSYNPFKKDEPTVASETAGQGRTGEKVPYKTEPTPTTTTSTTARRTDTPLDSASTAAPPTADTTTSSDKPIEPITGLPYDPSKDPAAAKRIEEREHGAMDLINEAKRIREEREATEGGSVGSDEKKSLGTRIKEKLHSNSS